MFPSGRGDFLSSEYIEAKNLRNKWRFLCQQKEQPHEQRLHEHKTNPEPLHNCDAL